MQLISVGDFKIDLKQWRKVYLTLTNTYVYTFCNV